MRELLISLGVLFVALLALTWGVFRVVDRSSARDFASIERAMNEKPRPNLTRRISEFFGAAYFKIVARTHGAQLFQIQSTGEWCVVREFGGHSTYGFGKTPFEAWHDFEYSRLIGE